MKDTRSIKSLPIHKSESEGFDSVDAATNVHAPIEAVSEAEPSLTTIEEDDTSLKSLKNAEGCQKAYSRDFLLSFQSHPVALERPQSKDPSLVLPEVNLMALQMLKDFPNSHPRMPRHFSDWNDQAVEVPSCYSEGASAELQCDGLAFPEA